jgi:ADP-heptose:LPS heptosyltransferase/glycosyltransferase involved in cell wall biosynthesis
MEDNSLCYLIASRSIGDTLNATPVLRKLFNCYNEKLHVVTHHPTLFQNSPYVETIERFDGDEKECSKKYANKHTTVFESFFNLASHGSDKPEKKHNTYDIRQFHATDLGMMLKPKELHCDFFPNPKDKNKFKFPENYVCIHCGTTWPSRTWKKEEFQKLVNTLNEFGLPVVLVGQDDHETGFWGRQEKPTFDLNVENGVDLCNQTDLNECWHIINDSICFVTMDSGLLHLAGTTDVQIFQLGSSIDPILRAPFRRGSQNYKYSFIGGECDIFCGSDVKYGIPEWGSIHGVPPLIDCLEKKPTFECHPSAEKVAERIMVLVQTSDPPAKKPRVLLLAEHLSTGGMPEVFRKRVEILKDSCEIFVVEFTLYSGSFVVQRKQIIDMLPEGRFITLGYLNESPEEHTRNRMKLMDIIDSFKPDFVHLEEVPEKYAYGGFPDELAIRLYSPSRNYKIFETSHDSGFDPDLYKKYLPDKFLFISKWHLKKYKNFDVPQVVIEYPIEKKERPNREKSLEALGLDPKKLHVLNVGLFTTRKNQGEIFEYAKKLNHHEIQFHFIGNLASNFESYWGPIIENKSNNCKVWGERKDVEKFYQCMDLFVFTSKGHETDRETNPIVIKEALSWRMKLAIRNLEVYMGAYDENPDIMFLSEDIDENCETISNLLGLSSKAPSSFNIKKSETKLPSKVVVTHTTKQYLKTAECLVKSLNEFSKTPIALYTINCEADFDYPNLIKIPRETREKEEPALIQDSKGDKFKDAMNEATYKTLTQKPGIMLDVFRRGGETSVYVDTDMICNTNFDTIFEHEDNLEDYPLITEGVFQYMAYNGRYDIEKPLMEKLGVKDSQRTWYRQTNTVLVNRNCTQIIEEWDSLCKDKSIIENWRTFAPCHEETIVNVLLWKYNKNKFLPQTFLNSVNVETIKFFKNCNVEKYWNPSMNRAQIPIHESEGADRGWLAFGKDKNEIKLFHGMKDPGKINPCIEYLKNE